MKINNLSNIDKNLGITNNLKSNDKIKESSFSSMLYNALDKVNDMQIEADNYDKLLATDQITNIHDVPIAAEKAKIAMQITLTVRNKIVDAYKEVMRMQV
ncbi:flagellar hook-basal body complex protein FliE [Brassicibacter mesophilus]|uniref:flagellar hook-basal body complex protein FliE n=1 Tax=Brassicibacter mesophilus TaxID=745119 RepID=UPI003D1D0650